MINGARKIEEEKMKKKEKTDKKLTQDCKRMKSINFRTTTKK